MKKIFKKNQNWLWPAFRIIVGFLFFVHGGQKLFGWFGGNGTELFSLFGAADIIEFSVGILLVLGLFTRYAALIGALEMIGAYVIGHMSSGIFPWQNRGELPLLYLAAFAALMAKGAGKFAVDK